MLPFNPVLPKLAIAYVGDVVIIPKHEDDDDDKDFTTSCRPHQDQEQLCLVCDTPDVVAAESSLFNGARQALVRDGAHFGGLLGRGNAAGRVFRLQLDMARSETNLVGSSIVVYQVSVGTNGRTHPLDSHLSSIGHVGSIAPQSV